MTDITYTERGKLASLVGSRLCHDLVSPLGAIGNGIELLELSGEHPRLSGSPEMQLISDALTAAKSRIEAYRIAFGHTGGSQRIPANQLPKLFDGAITQGRIRVEVSADGDFARTDVQMVILAAMCLETAIPWGGRLMVLRTGSGWRLVVEGDRVRHDAGLWSWLNTDTPPERALTPSEAQFGLLAVAVREAGRKMGWNIDEKGAEITL